MNKDLTVINLLSGPGAGKSTNMAGLFYIMKSEMNSVELAHEWIKSRIYDGFLGCTEDQIYVFGNQYRQLKRLVGKVDYAVTDSPLLLSILYQKGLSENFNRFVIETFNSFNNINIFINRTKPYVKVGRTQSEEEAKEIDKRTLRMLDYHDIDYIAIDGDENFVDVAYQYIKGHPLWKK